MKLFFRFETGHHQFYFDVILGDNIWEDSVALGSWDRAEDYMHDIIEVSTKVPKGLN